MTGDTISIRIRLQNAAQFAGEVRVAAVEIDELGNAAARAEKKADRSSKSFSGLGKVFGLLKPATLITGIALLAQSASALTAGAVGLTSSLAPVAGLLATLPAFAVGAAQGMGVLKLGFNGVLKAVGGLNQQMNAKKFYALQKPAQDFALTLNSFKGPILAIQQMVQRNLFGGLTKGLQAAKPLLSALAGPLAGTARMFGELGNRLGHLVGSGGFLQDLRSQAQFNNVQLGRMGGAGLHVVDALRQIMVVSRPLVAWLVKLVAGWAATADHMAIADRANGKMGRAFHTVQVTVGKVIALVKNFGLALYHIGNISRSVLGNSLLDSLVKGAKHLNAWTKSGPGIRKIQGYFAAARPVVYAVAKLFGAIVKSFLGLGAGGSGLASLFDQIRIKVLPVLTKLFSVATTSFGPALIGALTAIGAAFTAMGPGPIILLAKAISAVAASIAWVASSGPVGAWAVKLLFGAFLGYKVISAAADALSSFKKSYVAFKIWLLGASATTGAEAGAAEAGAQGSVGFLTKLKAPFIAFKAWLLGYSAVTGAEAGAIEGGAMAGTSGLMGAGVLGKIKGAGAFAGRLFGLGLIAGLVIMTPSIIKYFDTQIGPKLSDWAAKNIPGVKAIQDSGPATWLRTKVSDPVMKFLGLPTSNPRPSIVTPHRLRYHGLPHLTSIPGTAGSTPVLHAPVHATVHHAKGEGRSWFAPVQHIHVHSNLHLDGQKVAENTSQVVARHQALQ